MLVLALLLLAQVAMAAGCREDHQIRFYIFGSMGCPHCRHLKEELARAYGEGAVVFIEVSERENAERLIALYALLYPEVEEVAVPLTIVVVDGSPAASAVGAWGRELWESLIEEHMRLGRFLKVGFDGRIQVADRDHQIRLEVARIIGLAAPTATTTQEASSPAQTATYSVSTGARWEASGDGPTLLLAALGAAALCAALAAYLRAGRRRPEAIAGRDGR